jgi:hypothetical protein
LRLTFVQPPANDNFADRIALSGTNSTVYGSNMGASLEPGEPNHTPYSPPSASSVWWTWTAPTNGRVTLVIGSANSGPAVAVYSGDSVSNLTLMASANGGVTNVTVFNLSAGAVCQIAVAGNYAWDMGDYALTLSFVPAPLNDEFARRIVLSGTNASTTGTSVAATKESGEPAHAGNGGGHSVWWTWTAPANGRLTVTTSGSGFDTLLAVYTGDSVSALTLKAANDDATGSDTTSLVALDVTAGTNYQIAVDGYNGAEGLLHLGLAFAPASSNDDFANRITLAGSMATASGSNRGATREAGEPIHGGYPSGHSVWWTWTAPNDGTASVEATGDFSNVLGVYANQELSNLVAVAVGTVSGTRQKVVFHAVAGQAYQIAVDGKSGASGSIALSLSFQADVRLAAALNQANGYVRLTLFGQPGAVCEIQASTNLVNWDLLDLATNETGITEFTDTSATNFSKRFYRMVQRP